MSAVNSSAASKREYFVTKFITGRGLRDMDMKCRLLYAINLKQKARFSCLLICISICTK